MPEACGTSRREVLIFALLTAACVAADAMLYVTLPVFWREAGLDSLWEVGVVLALNRLARLPLNPLIGWAYTRLNTKTCAALPRCFPRSFPWDTPSRPRWRRGLRCACCGGWPGRFSSWRPVSRSWPRRVRRTGGYFMGLFTGTYRLGNLAGMLGGGLLADLAGLRVALLAGAAAAALALPAALFLLRGVPPSPRKSKNAAVSPKALLHSPEIFWVLVTCMAVTLIIEGFSCPRCPRSWPITGAKASPCSASRRDAPRPRGVMQSLRWGWDPLLSPLVGRLSDGRLGRVTMFAAGCWTAAGTVSAHRPFAAPRPVACRDCGRGAVLHRHDHPFRTPWPQTRLRAQTRCSS